MNLKEDSKLTENSLSSSSTQELIIADYDYRIGKYPFSLYQITSVRLCSKAGHLIGVHIGINCNWFLDKNSHQKSESYASMVVKISEIHSCNSHNCHDCYNNKSDQKIQNFD